MFTSFMFIAGIFSYVFRLQESSVR